MYLVHQHYMHQLRLDTLHVFNMYWLFRPPRLASSNKHPYTNVINNAVIDVTLSLLRLAAANNKSPILFIRSLLPRNDVI